MTYQAIVSYWNGASYSSDGEQYVDHDTLAGAQSVEDGLIDLYDTDADGEPCDVDLLYEVYEIDADGQRGDEPIWTKKIKSGANERAQESAQDDG